jgi:acetylornithine deacetylase/succinyl-diaminopimelate desuccinylase-like protein
VAAASNTLIPVARAKVSMRIAPGDDAAAACAALAAHLTAHAPWGAQVSVQPGALAAPFTAPVGGRAYRCARSALGEAWGRPAVDAGAGGSIPFVTAYAGLFPDAEILITGVEDPGTRAHGSNESLHLATFERACLAEALLLRNLAG